MPRPRRDGQPTRPTTKVKLTDANVRKLQPETKCFLVWDLKIGGLAICVHPTGRMTWKVIYSFTRKLRWLTIGKAYVMDVDKARELAAQALLKVATGVDVQAELKASRGSGTFEELANRYCDEYAKKRNKSWKQAHTLVRNNVLPTWAKLRAADISRSDVKLLLSQISSASVGTQTIPATSAIFGWAIREEISGVKANPCYRIEFEVSAGRERVLSDSEIPQFWAAFDDVGHLQGMALKVILLTGQRPGEVQHMRTEHIADGWWTMPGGPVDDLKWPGTKNAATHRVWLPKPVQAIVADLNGHGLLFRGPRGEPVELSSAMRTVCKRLKVERATPHDLRRTHGTMITSLGFGRDALNRIQNHKAGGIASVYDRHHYSDENKKIMEAVASRIILLVEGGPAANVIQFGR